MNDRPSNSERSTAIMQVLGETYLARGQYAEAAGKFAQLVESGNAAPEMYRNLALALLALNQLNDYAQQIYQHVLHSFPDDREVLLKICRVLLGHNARDSFALQLYKQALLLNPPAGREILQALAQHFLRNEQAQPAFETLKRLALFESGAQASTLAQLVHLGWRLEKYADTRSVLEYLAARNEKAAWIPRWLALDIAYGLQRTLEGQVGGKQSGLGHNRNPRDWRLISQTLMAYERIEHLIALREFSVLRLALALIQYKPTTRPTQPEAAYAALFFKELAQRLPVAGGDSAASALHIPGHSAAEFVVVLKISNFEKLMADNGEIVAHALARKFLDFAAKYFVKAAHAHCCRLHDGLLAFADSIKLLAIAAVDFLHKVERYNTAARPAMQIWVQLVAHAAPDGERSAEMGCWRVLSEALHLVECRHTPAGMQQGFSNGMSMARRVYESKIGYAIIPAKPIGQRTNLPLFHAEICEAIWRNPLEYVEERKPHPFGKFWVTEKLRGGREAGVYRARDRELERHVILKALSPANSYKLVQDAALRERVRAALRQIGRLALPGIAMIYDMGVQEEIFFFVREYLEGKSLDHVLQSGRRLSLLDGLTLGQRICRILHAAHRAGVVHGNLKPGNIWLAPSGEVMIADFYTPLFVELPDPNDLLHPANWQYSAPERRKGAALLPTADIFSLGAILNELITGQLPITAEESAAESEHLAAARTPEPPPPFIAEIVGRACHAISQERFQSLVEFEQTLRRTLELLRNDETVSFDEISHWPEEKRFLGRGR